MGSENAVVVVVGGTVVGGAVVPSVGTVVAGSAPSPGSFDVGGPADKVVLGVVNPNSPVSFRRFPRHSSARSPNRVVWSKREIALFALARGRAILRAVEPGVMSRAALSSDELFNSAARTYAINPIFTTEPAESLRLRAMARTGSR
jgi:hypothetical protein